MVGRGEGLGAGGLRDRRQCRSRGRGGGVVGERVCCEGGCDCVDPSTRQRRLTADRKRYSYVLAQHRNRQLTYAPSSQLGGSPWRQRCVHVGVVCSLLPLVHHTV